MQLITASKITPFLAMLYIVVIDRMADTRKPDEDTVQQLTTVAREVLPVWQQAIPELRPIILDILRGNNKDEAYLKLGSILKTLGPMSKKDFDIPADDIELMAALGSYFRTESATALAKIIKNASLTHNSWVVQALAPKVGSQHETKLALNTLIKSLVGHDGTILTLDEANTVKSTKPESYKAYLALRRDFNQSWKDALVAFIRKSGEETVPYEEAIEYLHLNGIEHLMPKGFTGRIDDLSRLYTDSGKMIEGVPNAVTFPTVKMNPTYGKDGDWVFMAIRTDGKPGPYFYTSDYKKSQSDAKFTKVKELATIMPSMRRKWFQLVKNFDITKPECVAAVIIEILFECSARVGSVGNETAGEPTFGVATLLLNHVIMSPNGSITLRYNGKHGIAARNKINPGDPYGKYVIEAIKQLVVDKKPRDRLFTYDKGSRKIPIAPSVVNKLFHAVGAPAGTNLHKIRTYQGTMLFDQLMEEQFAKTKQPTNEKDAMVIFQKMSEVVGKKLNHIKTNSKGEEVVTGTTALNNYVSIESQLTFWRTLGLRLPKYLEKLEQQGDTE